MPGCGQDVYGRNSDRRSRSSHRRLSRELTCLIGLVVLTAEEEEMFSAVLQDLWMLAARAGDREVPADDGRLPVIGCLYELTRMIRPLSAGLDLAYRRRGCAA